MHKLLDAIKMANRSLAILIDPEKTRETDFPALLKRVHNFKNKAREMAAIDALLFFVGGSTMEDVNLDAWLQALGKQTNTPIVIFPGSYQQLSEHAHGLLFLNLLSGDNVAYLIGQQRQAASQLKETRLEIIPTAYLLIDGETVSAVQRVSQTLPLAQHDIEAIVDTAYAGELMGNKLVYLEAGSGAKKPVNTAIIKAVNAQLSIPVIVGGGIRDFKTMNRAFEAGANMVVVGTAIEDGGFG